MKNTKKIPYIIGIVLIVLLSALLSATFFMLSQTSLREISFLDFSESGLGWKYTILQNGISRSFEPEFQDHSMKDLPEGTEAVKITRTLAEYLDFAELALKVYVPGTGIEVFLNDQKLYSDFDNGKRTADGFLKPAELHAQLERTIRLELPENYTGSELTVITYFPPDALYRLPVYPSLCSDETDYAVPASAVVMPIVSMTLCAILAVLSLMIFVFDLSNGSSDPRTLLLTLFFLLLFIDRMYSSIASTHSMLSKYVDLSLLSGFYVAPLLFYFSLNLPGKKKYFLAALIGIWLVQEGICVIQAKAAGSYRIYFTGGLWTFALFPAVFAASLPEFLRWIRHAGKTRIWLYAAAVLLIGGIRLSFGAVEFDGSVLKYTSQIISDMRSGHFISVVSFLSETCAVLAAAGLLSSFLTRTLRMRETLKVLEERSRFAMESYHQMVREEESTLAAKHEMRHHMIAIAGMLQNQEPARALDYVQSVQEELDHLPKGRYSKNTMVNVIAGSYLERALAENIEVTSSLNIPETLPVADSDLCVFLTNMLENALNACREMKPTDRRYIHLKMYLKGNFLVVSCKNSALPEDGASYKYEESPIRSHDYGIANMRRIAEKYNSTLKIDRTDSSFSLMSYFDLP